MSRFFEYKVVINPVAAAYLASAGAACALARPAHVLYLKLTRGTSSSATRLSNAADPYLYTLFGTESESSESSSRKMAAAPQLAEGTRRLLKNGLLVIFAPFIIVYYVLGRQTRPWYHFLRGTIGNSAERARGFLLRVLDAGQAERTRICDLEVDSLHRQISCLEDEVDNRNNRIRCLEALVADLQTELEAARKTNQDLESKTTEHEQLEKSFVLLQTELEETRKTSQQMEAGALKLQEAIDELEEQNNLMKKREHVEVGVNADPIDKAPVPVLVPAPVLAPVPVEVLKHTPLHMAGRSARSRIVSLDGRHLPSKSDSGDDSSSNSDAASTSACSHDHDHPHHFFCRRALVKKVRGALHIERKETPVHI